MMERKKRGSNLAVAMEIETGGDVESTVRKRSFLLMRNSVEDPQKGHTQRR